MLHHVLKVPDALAKCKGIVPPAYLQWYLKLHNSPKEKSGSKKRAADDDVIMLVTYNLILCPLCSDPRSLLVKVNSNWHGAHIAV